MKKLKSVLSFLLLFAVITTALVSCGDSADKDTLSAATIEKLKGAWEMSLGDNFTRGFYVFDDDGYTSIWIIPGAIADAIAESPSTYNSAETLKDMENGEIIIINLSYRSVKQSDVEFSGDSTLTFEDDKYIRHSDSTNVDDIIKEIYDECCGDAQVVIEKEAFEKRYSDALTNKDVQYDKDGSHGLLFKFTGSAELDDYYNWGYKNYESTHFCISVTPAGGGYTDRWYIYADREEFSELFNELKSGSKSITLVCKYDKYKGTTTQLLATLHDYYIAK